MTRRECQTCRFFQAAGFDNMGWCTHPKRRIGNDVRIFVRAQELPCRNDWANDLWQLADEPGADIVIDAAAIPVTPATTEELTFLAAVDKRPKPDPAATDAAARGEDVVVGEVTASIAAGEMSSPHRGRQTLRRAHEEVKKHNREPRSVVSPVIDDAGLALADAAWPVLDRPEPGSAVPPAPETTARRYADTLLPNGDVPPVQLGEIGNPFPKMTSFPEDDARFSSIPTLDREFDLPLAQPASAPRIVGRAGFDDEPDLAVWNEPALTASPPARNDDLPVFDEIPVVEPPAEFERPSEPAAPRRRFMQRPRQRPVRQPAPLGDDVLAELYATPELAPYLDELEHEQAPVYEQPVRVDEASPLALDGLWDDLVDDVAGPAEDLVVPEPRRRRGGWGLRQTGRRPVYRDPEPVEAYEPEPDMAFVDEAAFESTRTADAFRQVAEPARVEDYVVTPGTVSEEVAFEPAQWSAIPRMCRTCRDFRPAENGERGWCTNKWAFSHRRMVDADELPCETSIGGWWLPHDESWMGGVDISAHSQPTPLLDQWLALRAAASGEYDVATPIRRRQRS
ncbi:MAG: hypothetical protein IT336_03625 [Thermomicrobiales bacterium]|nr:hypothetical protein [Thermomicrobiales bacterium]